MTNQSTSRDHLIDNDESVLSAASTAITSMHAGPLITNENFFGERQRTATSISPEQALISLVKVMMGTGMLSLPLAFKYSGIWLGLILLAIICAVCTYCMRQLIFASNYLCRRKGIERMDYANVMRTALEYGPDCFQPYCYFGKQLVNSSMFFAQLGFCTVYFVFMADNLKQFFDQTSYIHISQAGWIALLLIPTLALCTIRELKVLAPLALIGNVVYLVAVGIVLYDLFANLKPMSNVNAIGRLDELPLFFSIVVFAFEGIAVILPIENQMNEPQHFISKNGVLNTACILVLAAYSTMGFYGYLAYGDKVVKIAFVACILISYPLQFYVPIERIEKWISRKVPQEKQNFLIYLVRYLLVIFTCLLAELIPHLALFISLIGAFAGTALALVFPPFIDLLTKYSKQSLTSKDWTINILLFAFGVLGFLTGTYTSIRDIIEAFGKPDDI